MSEPKKPVVPAEVFAANIAASIDNKNMSDAEFRNTIRLTLPHVIYPREAPRVNKPHLLVENPSYDHSDSFPFCAIRKRKPDGRPNVGGAWLEPMGPVTPYVADQRTWEVIFYKSGATFPD